MKFFRFEQPFDFKPSQSVTMHYAAGSVRKVTEAIAEAARQAGVGTVDEKATEEIIVDDMPRLASVIRPAPRVVPPARAAASSPAEQPAKVK